MPGPQISEDAKCILLQVLKVLRQEKGFGRPVGSFKNISRRFKLFTGYDFSTVANIEKQKKLTKHVQKMSARGKSSTCLPAKKGPEPKIDSFDREIIRRAIHSMYAKGMCVSLPALQKWLSSNHPTMQRTTQASLRRAALRLGFRYQKGMPDKRFRGQEESKVVAARVRYKSSLLNKLVFKR